MKKVTKSEIKRTFLQLASTAFFNGYAAGYQKGKIFIGNSKYLCVPILNCYSCPGALGACPIGSLQSVLSARKRHLSFYVFGTIMLFGLLFGRLICGFLCPFGLLQDLLHKIPFFRIKINEKLDKGLRLLKYVILIFFVLLLPMLIRDEYGIGTTWFCKYICPAGTFGAGLPLLYLNKALRKSIGALFQWKLGVLIVILVLSLLIYRPFCKYLCPLGGFYGLFNKIGFFQLKVDAQKCVSCHQCEKTCQMGVKVLEQINSTECIRCGKCAAVCPTQAIEKKIMLAKQDYQKSAKK